MRSKEQGKKGMEVYKLAEVIENSKQATAWKGEERIQLKKISQEDAQRLKELGLEFSDKYRRRTSENAPFTFFLDSAFSSSKNEWFELDLFSLTPFRNKKQAEGRVLLFSVEDKERFFGDNKERLYGLAKFGEKYDGVRDAIVEPGFFALVIFLKRESGEVE